MQKIASLFQRNYDGDRKVRDEIVEGSEWVRDGEGVATRKWDGTSCMVRDCTLWKRYDRKKIKKTGEYKPAPDGWIAAEEFPNEHTGHWPGWIPVGDGPDDRWHREAWDRVDSTLFYDDDAWLVDGTYELCGPKVQGNPEGLEFHTLIPHGEHPLLVGETYDEVRSFLLANRYEGIVWHHPDGRMVKIKRRDFPSRVAPTERAEP